MIVRRSIAVFLVSASAVILGAGPKSDDESAAPTLRDSFETPRTIWLQEHTDALIQLEAHDRSNRAAHEGQMAERFKFQAGVGSAFFFSYPLPKIAVTEPLHAGLYVRSNRTGAKLFARVVLPGDIDPDTGQPSFVTIPGSSYESSGRWQRLILMDLLPGIERQARVLRAATKRRVSLEGAYIERLVINLFGGAGETEIFVDDLTIGPVTPEVVAAFSKANSAPAAAVQPPATKDATASQSQVELDQNLLRRRAKDGKLYDWFFTVIDAPGADVAKLRHSGFDVLAERAEADPKRVREALKWGFLLLAKLDATSEGRPIDADRMVSTASEYEFRDSVAFWSLGDHLGRAGNPQVRADEQKRIRDAIAGIRQLPPTVSHITTGGVDGNLMLLASPPRNIAIPGISPNAWASSQTPIDTIQYLKQRRELTSLANPNAPFLAWLPATPPPAVKMAIWGNDVPPPWGELKVQPEQLRLMTYYALSAGYHGIGYRSDESLTSEAGRMLQIEMAFLNEEMDLCESLLVRGTDPIPLYATFDPDPSNLPPPGSQPNQKVKQVKELLPHPDIRAAAINLLDNRGALLLVANYAPEAQFQPAQMAANDLKVTVPAPESAQAWEISPGEVRVLARERVPGGTRISIPDFGTTTMILLTTDTGLAERIEQSIQRVRPLAVAMAIEQARIQYRQVSDINDRLLALGHSLYDENDPKSIPLPAGSPKPREEAELLFKADESLKVAQEALDREDYPLAWSEARRVGRPLRLLMAAQWAKAYEAYAKVVTPEDPKPVNQRRGRQTPKEAVAEKELKRQRTPDLISPVCIPPLIAYNTLPLFDRWLHWVKNGTFGKNLMPSGEFDDAETLEAAGWVNQSFQFDGITSKALVVHDEKDKTKRYLKLTVEPTDKKKLDSLPPFFEFPAAAIRSPAIPVERDQFYRITVLIKKPVPSPADGAGGVIITDSLGGETLRYRTNSGFSRFSKLVLYRYAPTRGMLTVTLGLADFGEAYFDGFSVERLEGTRRQNAGEGEFADQPAAPLTPEPLATPPATARRSFPRRRTSQ